MISDYAYRRPAGRGIHRTIPHHLEDDYNERRRREARGRLNKEFSRLGIQPTMETEDRLPNIGIVASTTPTDPGAKFRERWQEEKEEIYAQSRKEVESRRERRAQQALAETAAEDSGLRHEQAQQVPSQDLPQHSQGQQHSPHVQQDGKPQSVSPIYVESPLNVAPVTVQPPSNASSSAQPAPLDSSGYYSALTKYGILHHRPNVRAGETNETRRVFHPLCTYRKSIEKYVRCSFSRKPPTIFGRKEETECLTY